MKHERKLSILIDIFGSFSKYGEEFLFYCPRCQHRKRKLSINIKKDKFKCWTCQRKFAGGSILYLVKTYGSYEQYAQWKEASGQLELNNFDELLKELLESNKTKKEKILKRINLPDDFMSLVGNEEKLYARQALNYLKSRGIEIRDIYKWKIGFVSTESFSRFKGRIIIPSFDLTGRLNYFIARNFIDDYNKYMNPRIEKKNLIFNELSIDFREDIILVEGVFDAIKAENAIPLLGSSLSFDKSDEDNIIMKFIENDSKIFMALDEDAKGKELRISNKLLQYGLSVSKILTDECKDVGEMTKKEFQMKKENALPLSSDNFLYRLESVFA